MHDMSPILLVDDNQDDYEATLRSLKKNHLLNPVNWCRNGQDAMDYLLKEGQYKNEPTVKRPAMILLDLNMPGIDGRQVLQKIKDNESLRSIPVIILTTSADSKDIEQCYKLGASTYIQKPVGFDGLTEAIRNMKDYWFGVVILPNSRR